MFAIGLFLCLIAGLVPVLVYGGFVNWLDQHEKEPWAWLVLGFFWGAVPAVLLALVAQNLLDIPTTWILPVESLAYELVGSSLWAPITEEIIKGLGVALIMVLAHREIDSVLDGVIYGAVIGLGFAFTENMLYFAAAFAEGGWGEWAVVVLLRSIPFGLNHALFTGLTGAGLAFAYLSLQPQLRVLAVPGGLLAGTVFHALHNLGASLAVVSCWTLFFSLVFDWGGVLMIGVLAALIWRQEKDWISKHLPGEVTDELFQLATSWNRWQGAAWRALLAGDLAAWGKLRRLRQSAAELAFKKQRLASRGPDPKAEQAIEHYRRRLVELGGALPRTGSFDS